VTRLDRRRLLRLAAVSATGVAITGCRRGVILKDLSDAELAKLGDPTRAAEIVGQATRAAAERAAGGASARSHAAPATAGPTPTPPLARGLGLATDIALTPNDDFYVMKYGTIPDVSAGDFRLQIAGRVRRDVHLSLADIRALPSATLLRTLECISNPAGGGLIGNAVWTGARFADVLGLAGPEPGATELKLESADRYHTGVPLDLALDERSYLVYAMNGMPLPREHGFPARCLFPGRYGQKQPKWLTRITVQTARHAGHWEGQGWSDTAEIRVNSRVDAPRDHATARGSVTVGGIAFSGLSGVARVELVIDDTRTVEAVMTKAPAPFADLVWTEWSWTWDDPPPGNHVILARAVDGDGRAQHRVRENVLGGTFPDGTSEMHRVRVFVPGV